MKVTKYRAPPLLVQCIGPHTSECTNSRRSVPPLHDDFGNFVRCCFPWTQLQQVFTSTFPRKSNPSTVFIFAISRRSLNPRWPRRRCQRPIFDPLPLATYAFADGMFVKASSRY